MTTTPTLPAYLPHHIAVEVDRIITRSRPPFTFKTRLLNSTAGEPLKYAAQRAHEARLKAARERAQAQVTLG